MPGPAGRLNATGGEGSGARRGTVTDTVTSPDGTAVAFDRCGSGPALILVHGAFTDRRHPLLATVAATLAPWFTVFNYDRRGRGDSGDTHPYAVEREVEDLAALVEAAGGSAVVFGGSSGGALALEAATRLPAATALAVWEPPYRAGGDAPPLPPDFAAQLDRLVRAGRRGDAVERFLVDAAEVPASVVAGMRAGPEWADLEAIAHTLAYEAAVVGPGGALPAGRLARVSQPTLVLSGDRSPAWMGRAAAAVAAAVPRATHRVLEGQAHGVAPEALAPELLEFFVAVPGDAR